VNDRKKEGEIFAALLKPRFGDGVDVVIGAGRRGILQETQLVQLDLAPALGARGYRFGDSLGAIPANAARFVVLSDDEDFDLDAATRRAIEVLSKNPKGFFLMVESDLHTSKLARGLERAVAFDRIIRRTADRVKDGDTLILFTADHSYDFRVHSGKKGEPLLADLEAAAAAGDQDSIRLRNVRRDDDHTGEEVLVAALGPGAHRVRGILANTDIFHIMIAAYGWQAESASSGAK
jgi:alkaline phosphatase